MDRIDRDFVGILNVASVPLENAYHSKFLM
jgi:hypothetical protein